MKYDEKLRYWLECIIFFILLKKKVRLQIFCLGGVEWKKRKNDKREREMERKLGTFTQKCWYRFFVFGCEIRAHQKCNINTYYSVSLSWAFAFLTTLKNFRCLHSFHFISFHCKLHVAAAAAAATTAWVYELFFNDFQIDKIVAFAFSRKRSKATTRQGHTKFHNVDSIINVYMNPVKRFVQMPYSGSAKVCLY